jgi:hypothetical protein
MATTLDTLAPGWKSRAFRSSPGGVLAQDAWRQSLEHDNSFAEQHVRGGRTSAGAVESKSDEEAASTFGDESEDSAHPTHTRTKSHGHSSNTSAATQKASHAAKQQPETSNSQSERNTSSDRRASASEQPRTVSSRNTVDKKTAKSAAAAVSALNTTESGHRRSSHGLSRPQSARPAATSAAVVDSSAQEVHPPPHHIHDATSAQAQRDSRSSRDAGLERRRPVSASAQSSVRHSQHRSSRGDGTAAIDEANTKPLRISTSARALQNREQVEAALRRRASAPHTSSSQQQQQQQRQQLDSKESSSSSRRRSAGNGGGGGHSDREHYREQRHQRERQRQREQQPFSHYATEGERESTSSRRDRAQAAQEAADAQKRGRRSSAGTGTAGNTHEHRPAHSRSRSLGRARSPGATRRLANLALQEVYARTGGRAWRCSDWWLVPGSDVQRWHGVSVEAGNLVALDLMANELRGEVPSAVGDFFALRSLNLSYNHHLGGRLPRSIGNLHQLRVSIQCMYLQSCTCTCCRVLVVAVSGNSMRCAVACWCMKQHKYCGLLLLLILHCCSCGAVFSRFTSVSR